ncbi:uncharacterized protein LOC142324774 [Lycorma delicatula]|uniref:uncharacterized protein LOC142324774 n=1 Tax=Lycorma delicatula TaxID=130591 RepID=UPI003F5108BE
MKSILEQNAGIKARRIVNALGFAGDVALLGANEKEVVMREVVKVSIEKANKVGLEINIEKTQYMVITREDTGEEFLNINDTSFKKVDSFSYLGTVVNNKNEMKIEI